MSKAVDDLKKWFAGLDSAEKKAVVEFLYDGTERGGRGTATGSIKAGRDYRMYVGPAPSGSYCSQCGSPL